MHVCVHVRAPRHANRDRDREGGRREGVLLPNIDTANSLGIHWSSSREKALAWELCFSDQRRRNLIYPKAGGISAEILWNKQAQD